jgi:subtilisin family serine protease
MSRRSLVLAFLLLANLVAFAAAEAAPGLAGDPAGTLVAVVDSGVSAREGIRLEQGLDLVDGDLDASDPYGHGTAVAAEVLDACPGCTVLPVRVLSRNGTAPWARVAAGIVWAVEHGARVVNVSVAGTSGSPELRSAVRFAARHDVLVVAAAGNTADTRPAYPAAYPNVVGVAAEDATGALFDWSSRGRWVDLAAPGCATLPVGASEAAACGTSFAAPLVAGIAALERASDPAAGAAEVARRLPGLVSARRRGTVPRVEVSGTPAVGEVLRATATAGAKGAHVRWYRCPPGAGVHDCIAVSASATYRVSAADPGSTLVARLATGTFAGLWLAASAPVAV